MRENLGQPRCFTRATRPAAEKRACAWSCAVLLACPAPHAQSPAPVIIARTQVVDAGATQAGVMNRMAVVVDAGHGGADTGARIGAPGGSTILEKNVTLALATTLQQVLASRGFAVVMTRDSDAANKPGSAEPLSLDDRAGLANETRASACLLLHAAGSGHGVHLYTSELDGVDTEAAVLPWSTAQAAWVVQSAQLSRRLAAALKQGDVPRIVRRASVQPLDSLTCPAVIVELAPEGEDVTSVSDAAYQRRVAQAISGALEAWAMHVQPPPRLPNTLGRAKTPRTEETRP